MAHFEELVKLLALLKNPKLDSFIITGRSEHGTVWSPGNAVNVHLMAFLLCCQALPFGGAIPCRPPLNLSEHPETSAPMLLFDFLNKNIGVSPYCIITTTCHKACLTPIHRVHRPGMMSLCMKWSHCSRKMLLLKPE